MGNKVNPISLRLQLNKDWQSKWFADKNYKKFLLEDIEIREVLLSRFGKTSGVDRVEIIRSQDITKVVIHTSKPAILIGRSGQGINDIKLYLAKNCSKIRDPKTGLPYKKIEIEIIEVKSPDLNANLVGQQIAYQIEKRIAYKRAIKQAIGKIMDARAKGVKIAIGGRLGGAEIARSEHYGSGSMPLGRFRSIVDYAQVTALTTYGTVGIKVWIYKGDISTKE